MQNNTFGSAFFDSIRRSGIYRDDDRWFGGVASGYAARMSISPLLVRAAFIVLTFFGGIGAIIYGISWALLPEKSDGRIHLQEAFAGRFDGALALAGAVTLIGLISSGGSIPVFGLMFAPSIFNPTGLAAALLVVGTIGVVIGGIVLLVIYLLKPKTPPSPPEPPARGYPAGGYYPAENPSDAAGEPHTEEPAAAHPGYQPHGYEQAYAVPAQHYPPTYTATAVQDAPATHAEPVAEHVPPPPPVYQKAHPTKFRAPGPGRRVYLLAIALPLLAAAGILAIWQWTSLEISFPIVAIFATAAIILGIITIGLGIAGRRAGAINLLLIAALTGGAISGAATYNPGGGNFLGWSPQTEDVQTVDIAIHSMEDLHQIDWNDLRSFAWINLDIIMAPEQIDADSRISIDLPPGLGVAVFVREDLPIDFSVSGFGAYVTGEFYRGTLETKRATGGLDAGLSLSNGGSLHYQNFPADNPFTIHFHAPNSAVDYRTWSNE